MELIQQLPVDGCLTQKVHLEVCEQRVLQAWSVVVPLPLVMSVKPLPASLPVLTGQDVSVGAPYKRSLGKINQYSNSVVLLGK